MSLELFQLSSTNPNESVGGGGCLCHPDGKTDCNPPYVVFKRAFVNEDRSPHAVASAACVRAAVQQIARAGDDIPALGEPVNMAAAVSEQPTPTIEWDDLSPEQQRNVASVGRPGEVIRLAFGDVVRIPGDAEFAGEEPDEPVEEDPLATLAADAPQEVPGPQKGTYEPVEEEDAEPAEDELAV